MIKNILYLVCFIFISSCGDDANTEYENRRSKILGTWQFTETTTMENVGQVNNITSGTMGTITFSNDGTGIKVYPLFDRETKFDWIYQLSPEKISIISKSDSTSQGLLLTGESKLFDILENRTDNQQWIANDNTLFLIDSVIVLAQRETQLEMIR